MKNIKMLLCLALFLPVRPIFSASGIEVTLLTPEEHTRNDWQMVHGVGALWMASVLGTAGTKNYARIKNEYAGNREILKQHRIFLAKRSAVRAVGLVGALLLGDGILRKYGDFKSRKLLHDKQ